MKLEDLLKKEFGFKSVKIEVKDIRNDPKYKHSSPIRYCRAIIQSLGKDKISIAFNEWYWENPDIPYEIITYHEGVHARCDLPIFNSPEYRASLEKVMEVLRKSSCAPRDFLKAIIMRDIDSLLADIYYYSHEIITNAVTAVRFPHKVNEMRRAYINRIKKLLDSSIEFSAIERAKYEVAYYIGACIAEKLIKELSNRKPKESYFYILEHFKEIWEKVKGYVKKEVERLIDEVRDYAKLRYIKIAESTVNGKYFKERLLLAIEKMLNWKLNLKKKLTFEVYLSESLKKGYLRAEIDKIERDETEIRILIKVNENYLERLDMPIDILLASEIIYGLYKDKIFEFLTGISNQFFKEEVFCKFIEDKSIIGRSFARALVLLFNIYYADIYIDIRDIAKNCCENLIKYSEEKNIPYFLNETAWLVAIRTVCEFPDEKNAKVAFKKALSHILRVLKKHLKQK